VTYPGTTAENPDGTKALIVSLLGLFCCGPLAIWSLMMAINGRNAGYRDGQTQAAFVISIVALVLWAVGTGYGFISR
jgi:hypothetical protein